MLLVFKFCHCLLDIWRDETRGFVRVSQLSYEYLYEHAVDKGRKCYLIVKVLSIAE